MWQNRDNILRYQERIQKSPNRVHREYTCDPLSTRKKFILSEMIHPVWLNVSPDHCADVGSKTFSSNSELLDNHEEAIPRYW